MRILIIVDVQNDFCPGGSLAVKDGDRIIPIINKLSNSGKYNLVIATQDWHPKGHISFASKYGVEPFAFNEDANQVVWPDHCVMNTTGAELRPNLDQSNIKFIIRKGMNPEVDSYSAFLENDKKTRTGLEKLIDDWSSIELDVVGIATDVCVLNTALDAARGSWRSVNVIVDACAAVTPEGEMAAKDKMEEEGIGILLAEDVLNG